MRLARDNHDHLTSRVTHKYILSTSQLSTYKADWWLQITTVIGGVYLKTKIEIINTDFCDKTTGERLA